MNESKFNEEHLAVLDVLGFKEFDSSNVNHVNHEIEVEEGQKIFIEEELHRRRIFVKMYDKESSCGEHGYFEVYVLQDIGCGTICMPFAWSDLSAWWMHHLKMSLYGNGFMKDGQEVKIDGI